MLLKTQEELLREIEELRLRLEEAEETLRAIGSGEVDAFVVSGADGEQLFTLKGAEHPYRILVETMNEGAATLADDGTIVFCNNRLAALLRMPLEKIIGTTFESYASPPDKSLIAARRGKCTAKCDQDEITLITGEGNSVPVLISCCAMDLSGGHGVSVVVTDLTQQKRNEEFLASERLARSIIEQVGEAIVVCNEKGEIIRASDLAHQLCGKNPLLKRFDEMFPLRIQETSRLFSVIDPLRGKRCENIEVSFKRGDEQISFLLLNATPLTNGINHTIGCIVSLIDITKRKQTEEALLHSEERYRTLFNTLIVGFCIIEVLFDTDGRPVDYRFLEINPAFESQTGLKDAQGQLMRVLAPDNEEHWFEIYGQIALTGESKRFVNEARALNRWYDVYAYRFGKPENKQVANVSKQKIRSRHRSRKKR
jgi:PAS domain S-box-containing protein